MCAVVTCKGVGNNDDKKYNIWPFKCYFFNNIDIYYISIKLYVNIIIHITMYEG